MHTSKISPKMDKTLQRLYKKDKQLYKAIKEKMKEIVDSPDIEHYKNLRKPLQFLKRVHITKRFVLVFEYHKSQDIVEFYGFDHRDKIYKNMPRR